MTGWEMFSGGRPSAAYGPPAVSVTKTRQLYLNGAAAQLLGGAPRVELLWDAERRCIGLRAAGATAPHSYALSPHMSRGARQVAGRAFLDYYGLLDIVGQRLPAHLEGDVLVVPLAPATDAGPGVRS